MGIVSDHATSQIDEKPTMRVFVPAGRTGLKVVWAVLVRTDGDPADQAAAVRSEVQTVAPGVRFVEFQPVEELVGARLRSWRLGAGLFGAFGVLAVLVAAVGMYGVLSFEVAQRRRELGIRMALGAPATRVLGVVVGEGLRTALWGVSLGLAPAALLAPLVSPLLFRVSPRDPLVFGGTALLILGVGAVAAFVPALRATRVDPTEAMRSE